MRSGSLQSPIAAPLFLLSFRYRDQLAAAISRVGWRVIAARRAQDIERRFIASGATVAVVDARGAFEDGLAAVNTVADSVQANASALVVLLSHKDVPALHRFYEAGATHYLASPFGESELAQTLRFAERHSERLAGGWRTEPSRGDLREQEGLIWRMDLNSGTVDLSAALRDRLEAGAVEPFLMTDLFRLLDPEGRQAARGATRRLASDVNPTAFTHGLPGGMRAIHHISLDRERGIVTGSVETLDPSKNEGRVRNRDPLTGLGDGAEARRWLSSRLRQEGGAILLLLSISRFESINTTYGRAAGDAMLQAAARRIERVTADIDGGRTLLARMAGAEFLVGLGSPVSIEKALYLAERIVDAFARPFMSGGDFITLDCRVGVVQADQADDDPTALLRRASAALAEAKGSDTDPVRLLSSLEADQVSWANRLATDLRQALADGEIDILFQPQVSVIDGTIVGVEALARWRHPDFGELGAGTLLAAAERAGSLVELSDHIQARAIAVAAAWPDMLSGLRLSVNVTAADIARPSFAQQVLALADDNGFPRTRLTVEITESGLIDDLNAAAELLAALRAGGCRVAIDDFGTGYSSLAYLKALPLDYLKIDRRLSQDIAGSPRDRVVVRGVIEMARSLGLSVIAEGVETEEQLQLLAREGCNYYQGFLCAGPLNTDDLIAKVAETCASPGKVA